MPSQPWALRFDRDRRQKTPLVISAKRNPVSKKGDDKMQAMSAQQRSTGVIFRAVERTVPFGALVLVMLIAWWDNPAWSARPTRAGTACCPEQGLTYLGTIRPRHAREIEASNWSVGAETMDRDYTIYAHWRNYLGPLGVKMARIQSGWAKTERRRGQYDWAWLDEIIPDMASQGVQPWVCLCYGNPIYPDGGGTGLGGGLPSSPEALAAWDAFVAAFVQRYKQYVTHWEVWNEPKIGRGQGAVIYARFVARTAAVVRRYQPQARVIFAAGAAFDLVFVEQVLTWLRDNGKLHLVDEIAYHPYAYNPDDSYERVEELRRIAHSFSSRLRLRQGENGAPSQRGSFGAISKHDWTELRQAKWATRRLLGDLGRDIPSSYFSICDMAYYVNPRGRDVGLGRDQGKHRVRINTKGLLAINPDRTVHHAKLAYRAVQHITALFDNRVTRIKDFKATLSGGAAGARYSVFGYRGPGGGLLVTVWRSSDRPGERPERELVSLHLPNSSLDQPVWIDLVSGRVYAMDDSLCRTSEDGGTTVRLPVYDSVIVLAERSAIGIVRPTD